MTDEESPFSKRLKRPTAFWIESRFLEATSWRMPTLARRCSSPSEVRHKMGAKFSGGAVVMQPRGDFLAEQPRRGSAHSACEPTRSRPREVRDGLPRIAAPVNMPSAGGLRNLPALVAGAEALVETLHRVVLLQHREVETAVGVVRATPRRDLGHEPSAEAPPLVLGSDVDVVE